MKTRRIAIGSDHGGLELKNQLVAFLKREGHEVTDSGTHTSDSVDYPRFAFAVANRVRSGECEIGIVVDGAGIGSAMAANKVPGVRAAACYSVALAKNAREHNNANVLTLGAGQTTLEQARPIVTAFLSASCREDRHLRRVEMIMDIEAGRFRAPPVPSSPAQKERGLNLSTEDAQRVTRRVRQLLAQRGATAPVPAAAALSAEEIAQYIDHTLLKPEASTADIDRLCREAIAHGFYSVCVNSSNVREAKNRLRGSPVRLCSVVGFPLGATAPDIKALETRKAIREGADEIDMVINVGAIKSGDDDLVLQDIRAVVEACRERNVLTKVILETAVLTDEEKVRACQLSMQAGADFVKTSTGFGPGGATVQDVALMNSVVAPKRMGVKASGGIRSYADAVRMIDAGATRIGASSGIRILEEARAAASGAHAADPAGTKEGD